jgi:hypothetical protein
MIFGALTNSVFGGTFCVTFIYHKETLVQVLDHLEKISRSNLFEFFRLTFLVILNLLKPLVFLQPNPAKY